MSHRMTPMTFPRLMEWLRAEYERSGTIFGVTRLHRAAGKTLPLFGEQCEAPIGPAAGPNTQLAQNIVAAYAAGARFFELKTVQIMDGDELAACIPRPCILAADEGYNCEWSTELTVPQALEEYVKAWCALKLISRKYSLGDPDGFIFNLSVGYDLAGIQSDKIDTFIEGLKDASKTAVFAACRATLTELFPEEADFIAAISPRVCRSVTLSTLHGCPPEEIERIATYLIQEKGLHTFVKCNPTILGYETARRRLDALGYDYIQFGEKHFNEDLQYADAVPMFRRLQALADRQGLTFGVKLSNTFPVDVAAGELPSEEMYMSGRSLFPLTIEMARRLSADFDGQLRISFSGGADAFRVRELFEAGIWPITVATTILKPGGYNRLDQLATLVEDMEYRDFTGVDTARIAVLADSALQDTRLRKSIKPVPPRKLDRKVPLMDCFTAPCHGGCPIHQDIPAYVRLAGEGKYLEALRVITERNPLPFTTGTICPHPCQSKCTRAFYEEPVRIREAKLESAEKAMGDLLAEIRPGEPVKSAVAVVGGGPAGLAAAYFLARAGWKVTVFERETAPGGIPRHVIPDFRILPAAIERDVELVTAMGAEMRCGAPAPSVRELRTQGYAAVVLAVGAPERGELRLEYGDSVNAIAFLRTAKTAPETLHLGTHVAVVGGGNTAMDTARAALRCPGVKRVSLVYRRDRRNMPADEEELAEALADGVEFHPLLAPIGVRDGVLTCRVMTLGEPDAGGRRRPVPTEETVEMPADTVIAAVGEHVDSHYYAGNDLALDERGLTAVDAETLESSVPGVYVVGDGRGGPATVVEAIADAARAAAAIAGAGYDRYETANAAGDQADARHKKGELCLDCGSCTQAERCLECAAVCEQCVDVCPNRANVSVEVDGVRQIVHLDSQCNECGNCAVFCPYDSAPYREKLTLFDAEADFADSENAGFLPLGGGKFRLRLHGEVRESALEELPPEIAAVARAVTENYAHLCVKIEKTS
jgi:putative selenate reductase